MNYPLVSAVIPNYNYGRFLNQAVDSVLAQTYPNIEVIVIDDGSTDESVKILRSYGDKIRWLAQKNSGVGAARNRGIAESRGEFIAFLDSDDIWLPSKLEKQIELFQRQEDIGLAHCGFADFDNAGKILKTHLDGLAGDVAEEMIRYRRAVILGGGSAVVVRRAVLEKIDGFDQTCAPAEDWEFYFQVARRFKIGFVPEILMHYREHGTNNHLNIPRMERAILTAFDKVFSEKDFEFAAIKNVCYGRIHAVLAGSYFQAKDYKNFSRQMVKSLLHAPRNIMRFVGFPIRYVKRLLRAV